VGTSLGREVILSSIDDSGYVPWRTHLEIGNRFLVVGASNQGLLSEDGRTTQLICWLIFQWRNLRTSCSSSSNRMEQGAVRSHHNNWMKTGHFSRDPTLGAEKIANSKKSYRVLTTFIRSSLIAYDRYVYSHRREDQHRDGIFWIGSGALQVRLGLCTPWSRFYLIMGSSKHVKKSFTRRH